MGCDHLEVHVSKVKPITAEEYVKVIDWAKQGMLPSLVSRVLLALAGFYNDTVADMRSRKDHDGLRDIESGYGLPVDNVSQNANGETQAPKCITGETQDHFVGVNKMPCQECGGRKTIRIMADGVYAGDVPCPTCQGEGR
jgi:hypothetical protein